MLAEDQMLKPIVVICRGVVLPVMGATALGPEQGGFRYASGDRRQEVVFETLQELLIVVKRLQVQELTAEVLFNPGQLL